VPHSLIISPDTLCHIRHHGRVHDTPEDSFRTILTDGTFGHSTLPCPATATGK
jgi:hypothetical protein